MIQIEAYREGLDDQLWHVFYTAIRQGCADHYSQSQLEAWAPADMEPKIFSSKMREIRPFIALIDGRVVGYADLQPDGYIDHFYVHGHYHGQGVGTALMEQIKAKGAGRLRLYSNVSKRAKPFFESHGFQVVKKQLIEVRHEHLENYAMELVAEPAL